MTLPKLTESHIRAGASPESFQRGRDYFQSGAISNAAIQGHLLSGDCEGTHSPYYRVSVVLDEAGISDATCTCPCEYGGFCKHIVALLLTYVHRPRQFAKRKEPAELLDDLGRDDLVVLLTQLLRDKPELYDWVEAALSAPSSKNKSPKRKRKKADAEVHRRQIVGILHSLDAMRMSEAYWHVGELANELRGVQATAMRFLDAGDADTALTILLTLLEEASRGIEFIDDSNGELGGFVGELGQPMAEAILSMELSQVERTRLADKLTKLVNHAGDYGMEGNLDIAIQAAQYGWTESPATKEEKRPRARESKHDDEWIDAAIEDYGWDEEEVYEGHDWGWLAASAIGDLVEAKLNVLERQGRTDEYLALCQKAERHLRYALKLCNLKRVPEAVKYAKKNLAFAGEALRVAESLRALRHVDEAIEIGEHGLKLKEPKAGLGQWLGPVEEAQGWTKQALAAWLAAFPENPSLDAYQTIKRLAESGWGRLRPDIMGKLRKSQNKQVLAEVFLFEQEWDEAIEVAEGRNVWYPVVETVADGVIDHRPDWVARASIKHAERLVVEPKSKNYPIAAEWLKRAKRACALSGKSQEWKEYLANLKEKYKRRPALQSQLQRL